MSLTRLLGATFPAMYTSGTAEGRLCNTSASVAEAVECAALTGQFSCNLIIRIITIPDTELVRNLRRIVFLC